MHTARCGRCKNCKDLKRVQRRVLACCNPPFSHADNGVVNFWNTELERLPCLEPKGVHVPTRHVDEQE